MRDKQTKTTKRSRVCYLAGATLKKLEKIENKNTDLIVFNQRLISPVDQVYYPG